MSLPTILDIAIDRKSYGAQVVMRDLHFALHAREIVALVGPSGCGKTTLLRMIGGLDRAFDGKIGWAKPESPRIGTVFQEPRLLPWRSVRENLCLVALPERRPAVDALLHALDLWAHRDEFPTRLSLGMARRVAIARAFVIEPDLMLLDEPFVSLDPAMVERSREVLLRGWRAHPAAVLLVTHDLAEAASLADRIILLSAKPMQLIADVPVPEQARRAGAESAEAFARVLRQTYFSVAR
jgi:ABC-type nitrate/sulfonate/bicarbonate transport system ATPase subunit